MTKPARWKKEKCEAFGCSHDASVLWQCFPRRSESDILNQCDVCWENFCDDCCKPDSNGRRVCIDCLQTEAVRAA